MSKLPELLEMLKSGVHFGHQSSKRYPKMKPFVHTTRNKIDIINLEETAQKLAEALEFVTKIVSQGGTVLFISSKRQAKKIIKEQAEACGMPYINSRWLGGTFTNFASVKGLTKRLKDLEAKEQSGELEKYTKKEHLDFLKEIEKLNELVGGIKEMNRLPEAVFMIDIKKERTALAEALKREVPVIALVDTNVNPEKIKYPIPGNDDAVKSIELITQTISQAISEVKAQVKE